MFDIGFYELLVVGIVALIVVGPKDLPRMFRTVGQLVGRAKGMARQFQNAMNDAARDADLGAVNDIASSVKKATDPLGEASRAARSYADGLKSDLTDGATGNAPADPVEKNTGSSEASGTGDVSTAGDRKA